MTDVKKAQSLKLPESNSGRTGFKQGFKAGKEVASAARRRRESEVRSLAKVKTRFGPSGVALPLRPL